MLHIPTWKRVLILGLIVLGFAFAMPNLFYNKVEGHNDAIANIERSGVETPEDIAARDAWPNWLPSGLVNLGLDLRGGAHLLGEVHVADVYKVRMDALWPELRDALVAQRDTVGSVRRVAAPDGQLIVEISNPAQMARAVEIARGLAVPVTSITGAGQSDLADCLRFDWVMQPAGSMLFTAVKTYLERYDLPMPQTVIETASLMLTAGFVLNSQAVGVMSTPAARLFAGDSVRILPVAEDLRVGFYSVVTLRDRKPTSAAQTFLKLLRDEFRQRRAEP